MSSDDSAIIGTNGREVAGVLYHGNWFQSESDESVGEGEGVEGEGDRIGGENVVGESRNIVGSLLSGRKPN